ncbi:pterin-4a-carbinolamine dehydratase [Brevibacterium sanguinis]|uniref:Putative pterin-4-alpha-carbinolamine dehydratase n=2 Tax=Brevibacterium TaxID=1696 RepID=A0A366IKH1_9MICO|nr:MULTISPECIES: 4a-hydroxytetrahydrobiopterin dehydratase [Brevibacterium]RBP64728.1 pterin-4a-carbinolamine dehydratase [Brevibacterium sanguinis]RBP71629.1 pterin-4a-carbinolamine dehydratase [Brevibacterium celere]
MTGSEEITHWNQTETALTTRFLTGSFVRGVAFINAITDAAEAAGHHPDVDLRYDHVDITLTTHDAGGLTDKDTAMAEEISRIATDQDISADPSQI